MVTSSDESERWDSLLRCLYRYVEANPDRFQEREERAERRTILRVVLAEDLQENEHRILRPLQLGQPEGDLD
jgi:hypothetical protein